MRQGAKIAAVLSGLNSQAGYDFPVLGTTPADLSDVVLWLEAASGTVRNSADGTGGAMVDGQTIGRLIRPGDSITSPAFPYATQSTGASKPVLNTVMGKYWVESAAGGRHMDLSTNVVLTGDFVAWFTAKRVSQTALGLIGHGTTPAAIYEGTNDRIAVSNDAEAEVYVASGFDPTSEYLLRVRRVSGEVYAASTGIAEVQLAVGSSPLSGDLTLNQFLSSYWSGNSEIGNGIGAIVISTNAGHAASPPSYIDGPAGYFATSTANVESAWGVSI